MKILAFETSHDDTSVAIYQNKNIIYQNKITQSAFHSHYGGTVPEYAARLHYQNLSIIIDQVLKKHDLNTLDAIAYTEKPGLVGSLQMGRLSAYALAYVFNKPIYPIDHLHGHIFAIEFTHKIVFPALALVVSGGHTQLWEVHNYNNLIFLAKTRDDALGEVFDKVARFLDLGFPGGPVIDNLFRTYQGPYLDFQINVLKENDFAFAGLKTKVQTWIKENLKNRGQRHQVAASFNYHAVNYLIATTKKWLKHQKWNSLILGGGVAANTYLRQEFAKLHKNALIPEIKYTTDNAEMIAITCDLQINNKL